MSKVVVIPMPLREHGEAFQYLDQLICASYSYFARLVIDAYFTPQKQRPTPQELSRALFNFIQENQFDNGPDVVEVPDVIIEHIEAAAKTALDSVGITARMAEQTYGPIPTDVGYDLLPSRSYDLAFCYDYISKPPSPADKRGHS